MTQKNRNKLIWTQAWTMAFADSFNSGAAGRVTGASLSEAIEADFSKQLRLASEHLSADLKNRELPFVSLDYLPELVQELEKLAPHIRSFRHMLLLGIGGSALGARALQKAFYPRQDWPGHSDDPDAKYLWIADNVDPESLPQWFEQLPARQTLVVAVSKSGGTIETMGQYFLAKEWLQEKLGIDYKNSLLLITDKKSGFLRAEAEALGLATLPVPAKLGGRYSALSAVGLVPALFLGMDWKALLAGAKDLFAPFHQPSGADELERAIAVHPAWKLAVWAKAMMRQGFNELIYFTYIPKMATFGPWFTQLWAESLGKNGKGSMPLPATGVTDQHSLQQMFLDGPRNKACIFVSSDNLPEGMRFPAELDPKWSYLAGKSLKDLLLAETLGTRMALSERDVPLLEIRLAEPDEYNAGKLMALLGLATIFTGWLMGINPLDQPAVELGKRLANASLGAAGLDEEKNKLAAFKGVLEKTQDF